MSEAVADPRLSDPEIRKAANDFDRKRQKFLLAWSAFVHRVPEEYVRSELRGTTQAMDSIHRYVRGEGGGV